MRRSQQNRPSGEFQGPPPYKQRKRQGRRNHRSPEEEHQRPPRDRRNRRRNPNQRRRNQENHPPRGRRSQFRHRKKEGFRPAAGFAGFDDRIEIIVELPGVEEKDINVSVAGNRLIVKGKKNRKQSEEKHHFGRSELQYGKFHRTFPLLPITKSDGIKAEFKEGILTIVIPKKEEAKPKEIPINAEA